MATVHNIRTLPRDNEEAISWAKVQGLLPTGKQCGRHRTPMHIRNDCVAGRFYCPRSRSCRTTAVAHGTFSEECRIPLYKAITLMYGVARDWSYDSVSHEVDEPGTDIRLSTATICQWYKYCREMAVDHFSTLTAADDLLGGSGVIVQIDESKFGHRKYNRGRIVDDHWVLGIIEKSGREDVRMVELSERDAETLIPIIQRHVRPGSEIHTDMWRAYNGLEAARYIHRVVNHSDPVNRFVAPDGTHAQRIEATWRPAKNWFKNRHVHSDQFADTLCEYLWRRHCRFRNIDPFSFLLEAIRAEYQL